MDFVAVKGHCDSPFNCFVYCHFGFNKMAAVSGTDAVGVLYISTGRQIAIVHSLLFVVIPVLGL